MKINLRKANMIQQAIKAALKDIKLTTRITVNAYEDSERQIKNSCTALTDSLAKRIELNTALRDIRLAVSEKNEIDINYYLTCIAGLEPIIADTKAVLEVGERKSKAVISGEVARLRDSSNEGRYYGTDLSTSVLDASLIEQLKDDLAILLRKKAELKDKVLEANISTQIELEEHTVNTLKKNRIL